VLSTRCGGPEEFVGCHNGLLVPPADANALCRGLDTMLSQLNRYAPTEVARTSIERFSPERVGAQLLAGYREVKGSGPEIWSVGHSGHRAFIADGWSVLDVGSGHHPHPRATVLLDKDLGPHAERSGKTTVRDTRALVLGDAERLPFREHAFDYVIASHIAEHLSDPAGFCAELQRIARRGYLECPGPLAEFLLGEPFHLWVVTATGSRLVFRPNPPKNRLARWLSDSFYAVFYAGQQRSRPALQLHGSASRAAMQRLQWFLRRAWSSRLLRRWTWTRFPFDGPFEAHVRDH
jgi:hypothetical protein